VVGTEQLNVAVLCTPSLELGEETLGVRETAGEYEALQKSAFWTAFLCMTRRTCMGPPRSMTSDTILMISVITDVKRLSTSSLP